jgi:3-oxo-5-alpha-steroid 4-dehydrogenase 1
MIVSAFYIYLWVMIGIAVIVFITLNFVEAGYGMLISPKWGRTINNKLAWFLMEFPIFIAMIFIWASSPHRYEIVPVVFLLLFQAHYLQRVFVFPFLIKGKSKMPILIVLMGMSFNILNSMMQGYWFFFEAYNVNPNAYPVEWLWSPQFIIGTILFICGYSINLYSDHIIRHLRKSDQDTKHYLPEGGMFNYVTSANYFGELMEWLGFAILTWSISGLVFFIWTFANLVPRAKSIYKRYQKEYPIQIKERKLKRIFPFIY